MNAISLSGFTHVSKQEENIKKAERFVFVFMRKSH